MAVVEKAQKCLYGPCNRKTFNGFCYQHKSMATQQNSHMQQGTAGANQASATPPVSLDGMAEYSALTTATPQEAYDQLDMIARELKGLNGVVPPHTPKGARKVYKSALEHAIHAYSWRSLPVLDKKWHEDGVTPNRMTLAFELSITDHISPVPTNYHPDEIYSMLMSRGVIKQTTGMSMSEWNNYHAAASHALRMEWEIAQHLGLTTDEYSQSYVDFVESRKTADLEFMQRVVEEVWRPSNYNMIVSKVSGQAPLSPAPTISGITIRQKRAEEEQEKARQEELRRLAQENAEKEAKIAQLQESLREQSKRPPHVQFDPQDLPHQEFVHEGVNPDKPQGVIGALGAMAMTRINKALEEYDKRQQELRERKKREEEEARKKEQEVLRIEREYAEKRGMTVEEFRAKKAAEERHRELKEEALRSSIARNEASAREYNSRARARKTGWFF